MNLKQIKISVIIPTYNVQNYVEACIESVIEQCVHCEIIVIDDGSTDDTVTLVKKIQKQNANIILVEQKHKGPSSARNSGIKLAKGEFIVFLDSDDTLVSHSLNRLYKKAIKTDADILIGKMNYIAFEKKIVHTDHFPQVRNRMMSGNEYLQMMLENMTYTATSTNIFYKKAWLNKQKILFNENIVFEDELWTLEILTRCKKLYFSSIGYYNYHKRNGSITNSEMNFYKIESLHTICDYLIKKSDLYTAPSFNVLQSLIIINLIRICRIASYRINDTDKKKYFNQIIRIVLLKRNKLARNIQSCIDLYIRTL